jgi:predicted DCC family thiol-disulfide oxidoreductase YuxK
MSKIEQNVMASVAASIPLRKLVAHGTQVLRFVLRSLAYRFLSRSRMCYKTFERMHKAG